MTMTSLTINPEDVRSSAGARPAWLEQVAAYVQQAAADGETVTLTAKRRMMTPEQVADAMGVSRPTISRKIKAGEIRAVKVGNRNRIPYEEFERYWRKTMGDLVELTRDELRDDLFGGRVRHSPR
ncbi:MAG: excisionase [Microbacterium sp. 69-10]|uniref:helix-turn-helix domain-containing protein n=1 Tax=Microbacterium sp. 69-10 TaxID=1895783 RepID=UPI000960EE76|nr:helix-turn-helix domain-containing protein [Microbacterium sp. 69-10]OJU39647.1 MAG: excisionase [Microbacterium sp. 69-10]